MGWAVLFLSVLIFQAPEQKYPEAVGFLPDGALIYSRIDGPVAPFTQERHLLNAAGLTDLADGLYEAGIVDYFAGNRLNLDTYGWSIELMPTAIREALDEFDRPLRDYGRGTDTAKTQQLLESIQAAEFAVYPGGVAIQILKGDMQAWQTLAQEGDDWEQVDSVGHVFLNRIGEGGKSWYSALDGDLLYRSQDLDLLRQTVTHAQRGSAPRSLAGSAFFQEMVGQEVTGEVYQSGFVDLTGIFREIQGKLTSSPGIHRSAQVLLQGIRALTYRSASVQEGGKLKFSLITDGPSPVAALAGGRKLDTEFLKGGMPGTILRLAFNFSPEDFLAAVFSDRALWAGGADLRLVSQLISNLDRERSCVILDENDRSILALAARDGNILQQQFLLIQRIFLLLPGIKLLGQDAEKGILRFSVGSGDPPPEITLQLQGNVLFAGFDSNSVSELAAAVAADPDFLQAFAAQEDFLVPQAGRLGLRLQPLLELFTGDVQLLASLDDTQEPAEVTVAIEPGMNPGNWKKILSGWDGLASAKPQVFQRWSGALAELFEDVAEYRGIQYLRGKEAIKGTVAALPDRLLFIRNWPVISWWTVSGGEQAEYSPLAVEQSLKNRINAVLSGWGGLGKEEVAPSLVMEMDYHPIFQVIVEEGDMFRGFVQTAAREGWPWYSLETNVDVAVIPGRGDRLLGDISTNSRPLTQQMYSVYLDHYQPSADEIRALNFCLAVESAQSIYAALALRDANNNGRGEYGDFTALRSILQDGENLHSIEGDVPSSLDYSTGDFQYRLQLPDDPFDRERRWTLTAIPKPDLTHRLAFYIDERGILMAAPFSPPKFIDPTQLADLASNFLSSYNIVVMFEQQEPPEHELVYSMFLPYLGLYDTPLAPIPD